MCYLVAFVLGMKQLREPDTWWQLLAGRWMLQHHQVTHTDVFSYTMAGHEWTNVKWLYEVLIAAIEQAMGPLGVLLLQSVVNVAIVYFLFRCIRLLGEQIARQASSFFSIVCMLLFLVIVEYRMAGRPEMFSHLFCTIYLFFLLRYPKLEWKNIVWLVPLQCLWANMHDGYPVGLVMLGIYAAGAVVAWGIAKDKSYLQQAGRAIALFAASTLAVLINPNGIRLWIQPFEIYRQVWANKYTTELNSIASANYWGLQAILHIALLVLVGAFCIAAIMDKKKRSALTTPALVAYLLLLIAFAYLSLTANRNIPFAEIALLPAVPFMCIWLADKCQLSTWKIYKSAATWQTGIAVVIAAVFYINIVNNSYYRATKSPNRYGLHVNVLHNPVGTARFITEHHITGTAFADYFISSYLLWAQYPAFRSYIDLRDLDVFPATFFDQYFQLYEHQELFKALDDKYNFNYAVISTSQLVGLQHQLYWQKGYNMVYADPVSVIYLKQNEANKAINENAAIQKPFTWPEAPEEQPWANALNKLLNPLYDNPEQDEVNAPLYAAYFYTSMQDYPQAINMLRPALSTLQENPAVLRTMATIYTEYGQVTRDPALKQARLDSAAMYSR